LTKRCIILNIFLNYKTLSKIFFFEDTVLGVIVLIGSISLVSRTHMVINIGTFAIVRLVILVTLYHTLENPNKTIKMKLKLAVKWLRLYQQGFMDLLDEKVF